MMQFIAYSHIVNDEERILAELTSLQSLSVL